MIEQDKRLIGCILCRRCNVWVLCVCEQCEKEWWRRARLASRWCEECFEKQLETSRLLLISGHEVPNSERYLRYRADWVVSVNRRANLILVRGLECSKSNSVPAIWSVSKEDWSRTKRSVTGLAPDCNDKVTLLSPTERVFLSLFVPGAAAGAALNELGKLA